MNEALRLPPQSLLPLTWRSISMPRRVSSGRVRKPKRSEKIPLKTVWFAYPLASRLSKEFRLCLAARASKASPGLA